MLDKEHHLIGSCYHENYKSVKKHDKHSNSKNENPTYMDAEREWQRQIQRDHSKDETEGITAKIPKYRYILPFLYPQEPMAMN